MGRVGETQAPVNTRTTSSRPVPALADAFNPIVEEDTEPAPPAEAEVALDAENQPNPTEATDLIPSMVVHPNPTTEQHLNPAIELGSVPLTPDSELTQLTDTDTS